MIIKGLQCFMNPHDDKKKKKYQREKVYKRIHHEIFFKNISEH